jgi:hypothetical protein
MPEAALTVEECQKRAMACRQMAREETDPHARKTLEDLAASWAYLRRATQHGAKQRPRGSYNKAMKKLAEYLQHAAECREMARVAQPTHRAQLENMATTWEQLAEARKQKLAQDGKTDEEPD